MIFPQKLRKGDEIRVIALSESLSLISKENIKIAKRKLENLGFIVSFGKNVMEIDEFRSSSVGARIQDLHEAFDSRVKAILTVIGGYNSNQLLNHINYDLIKNNPKILCGYSDITAISNAITTKTGLITYSGPHFSTFAMRKGFDYNLEYFKKCLMSKDDFQIKHSRTWSDDERYINQKNRKFFEDRNYWILNEGKAKGKIIGGNLSTLSLLQGTKYMPNLGNSILFLEECKEFSKEIFDRLLQSLIQQKDFSGVKGIVIGRFQKKAKITKKLLEKIIKTKKNLNNLPIIANADFGHTNPMFTFPIGGECEFKINGNDVNIKILKH